MSTIEKVVERWRKAGIPLNAGASTKDLDLLERQLGMLPGDVRLLFSLANGMHDDESDEYFVSFWSIKKILREAPNLSRVDLTRKYRDTAIADVMIDSWFIRLRTIAGGSYVVVVDGVNLEVPSLTGFFDRYLNEPESIGLWGKEGGPK